MSLADVTKNDLVGFDDVMSITTPPDYKSSPPYCETDAGEENKNQVAKRLSSHLPHLASFPGFYLSFQRLMHKLVLLHIESNNFGQISD